MNQKILMNLGFKKQFVPKIKSGQKIHTVRKDEKNRWKGGKKIHFATGIRTKEYDCFKEDVCKSTQKIEFKWKRHNKGLVCESWSVRVFIDDKDVTDEEDIIERLVINDGFDDRKDFFEWQEWHKKNFIGKIIHWTDFKYEL